MLSNASIIAGAPGAGKTHYLLNLVEQELESGTPPDRICFTSFTKKAANEARDRACERFNLKKSQLPFFRTLHSLAFHALGLTSSEILNGKGMQGFGDWIGVNISGFPPAEDALLTGFEEGDRCLFIDGLARARGISLREQYDRNCDNLPWALVERVSRGLREYKTKRHLHDFSDLLEDFAAGQWPGRIEVLFVDEAQDLSPLQWRVVERLARGARKVVIAGDDDQAIYAWSGAAVQHFVNLPGQTTILGQSRRVPQRVQAVAGEVLNRIVRRRPKEWSPRPEEGCVRRVQSLDEVEFNAGEDLLVLSRNTSFLRKDVEPCLRSEGILYEYRGQQSVAPELVAAILDWERLRVGGTVTVREARGIYAHMTQGRGYAVGHRKLENYRDDDAVLSAGDLIASGGLKTTAIWHEALDRVPAQERAYMVKCLRQGEKLARRPTTRISTIHGSKGGEADHVVLLRDMSYRSYMQAQDDPEDEARVFYVAATRARKKLTIVAPRTNKNYDI